MDLYYLFTLCVNRITIKRGRMAYVCIYLQEEDSRERLLARAVHKWVLKT